MSRTLGYILGGFLIVIGFLGETYFGHYKGTEIEHPFVYRIVAWLLGIAGGAIYYTNARKVVNNVSREVEKWKDDLRQVGEKIIVDLATCEVKSNVYYEEVAREQSSEAQIYNAIIGQSEKNVEQQSRHSSVILYRHQDMRTGNELLFVSPLIRKEKVTLAYLIGEQKQTNLYVNRANSDDYFFDVDFLYEG